MNFRRASRLGLLPLTSAFALGLVMGLGGCQRSESGHPAVAAPAKNLPGMHAVIETDKGEIEFEFYASDSPKAVENFRLLAQKGYYDGLTFHRVVKGFMIQGGDPNGDGTGGESAWGGKFDDEIKRESPLYRRNYMRGIVAMANSGPNTNGSQFFILHQDHPLPPQYVIFGNVIRGMEVVDALAEVPTRRGRDRAMSEPIVPLVMRKVSIRP